MRQAGVLAAAGTVALETMVNRMAEDHANARRLAEGLAQLPTIDMDADRVQTNIVIFGLDPGPLTPADVVAGLAARGVKIGAIGGRRLRAVTHYGLEAADIDVALETMRQVLATSSD